VVTLVSRVLLALRVFEEKMVNTVIQASLDKEVILVYKAFRE
jgi:hypothetical protein